MSRTWNNKIVGHADVAPDQLLANKLNWRIHPMYQQKALQGVINDIGFIKSVTVNQRTGNVVDGHLRVTLALRDGIPTIPVEYVDLTEEEEAEALLTIDPIAALAGSDKANLETLLGMVQTQDDAVMKLLEETASGAGLDWGKESADAEPQIDRAAELQVKWKTETGQLWTLGNHRLLCGDCTVRENVERLMGGERAELFVTDPPYGVDYSALRTSQAEARRTTVEYDDIEADKLNGDDLQKFLESIFSNCKDFLDKNAAWYIWHAQMTQGFFAAAAAAAADILIHRQIIWVKPSFIFGRGDYHWKHELCFYGWVKGNRPPFYGERNQDTVWMLGGGGSSGGTHKDHPTQKPLEVYEIPIRNHTKDSEVMLDPFAGSGTGIIAAQNLSRRCFAMEISPNYCAVILERFQTAFPNEPIEQVA